MEIGIFCAFSEITPPEQMARAARAIEERGFSGSHDEIVSQALESTCGFNQVVVALKALLEHNATINVVADHI